MQMKEECETAVALPRPPGFYPDVQMAWFEEDGTVKIPIPVHLNKTANIGEMVWIRTAGGQLGTIVSEDVCSDGLTPSYLVRTIRGEYLACCCTHVKVLMRYRGAQLLAALARWILLRWRWIAR